MSKAPAKLHFKLTEMVALGTCDPTRNQRLRWVQIVGAHRRRLRSLRRTFTAAHQEQHVESLRYTRDRKARARTLPHVKSATSMLVRSCIDERPSCASLVRPYAIKMPCGLAYAISTAPDVVSAVVGCSSAVEIAASLALICAALLTTWRGTGVEVS